MKAVVRCTGAARSAWRVLFLGVALVLYTNGVTRGVDALLKSKLLGAVPHLMAGAARATMGLLSWRHVLVLSLWAFCLAALAWVMEHA